MRKDIVSALATIAEQIDFPPKAWSFWPFPWRRPRPTPDISAVARALEGVKSPVTQVEWATIWRKARPFSTRAYVILENNIRLVEVQAGLGDAGSFPRVDSSD